MNSASVVRYGSSTACGSCSSGGVANRTLLASEMTAQIAQASAEWSVSGVDGCCVFAASLEVFWDARLWALSRSACVRPVVIAAAAKAWKCPNDNANWIASANSASREPCLSCFRNHFMRAFVSMLYYNIERIGRCQPQLGRVEVQSAGTV